MMTFTDRLPAEGKENRFKLTKSDGTVEYVKLERADEANPVGTPLNKATFENMQTELMPVTGTYTGNGTSQTIELGFTPKCVIVFKKSFFIGVNYTILGMAIKDTPMTSANEPLIAIANNGFSIVRYTDNNRQDDLNNKNNEYMYIAFR